MFKGDGVLLATCGAQPYRSYMYIVPSNSLEICCRRPIVLKWGSCWSLLNFLDTFLSFRQSVFFRSMSKTDAFTNINIQSLSIHFILKWIERDQKKKISKQRRFHGNQFSVEKDVDIPSTSGEKLQHKENLDIIISSTHGYCILKEKWKKNEE